MNDIIVWSKKTETSYDKIIEDLIANWNDEIVKRFILDVDSLLFNLSKFNKLCPVSKQMKIRRCVLSKQTSLAYKIKGKKIYLLTFYYNRSGHDY